MKTTLRFILLAIVLWAVLPLPAAGKPRVLVTSDGEIDDECSLVRFLLYTNEWDVEGIITSSSQYHWHGHKWAGDDWAQPYLKAYAEVYPNLVKHDPGYRWWQYHEADSTGSVVAISQPDAKRAEFTVPDRPGAQVHIVLEVTDGGSPPLTRYERIIYTIR